MGTAFEKQEHIRCADKLIYNPRKHRCDDIGEFEAQFANGVQTGEELLEFMRFRNCIGSKNLAEGAGSAGSESEVENTSPPADYYPHVVLNDNRNDNGRPIYDVKNYEFFHELNSQNTELKAEKKPPIVDNYENDEEDLNMHKLISSISAKQTQNESSSTTVETPLEASLNKTSSESSTTTQASKLEPELNSTAKISAEKAKIEPTTTSAELKNSSHTFKPDTKRANNSHDFDSLFLMEDERIYFGKKLYFDSLKTNSSAPNKNSTFEKERRFNKTSEDKSIRIVGTEKRRGFFKTFANKNKHNLKAKAGGIYTTRVFKVFVRKNLIDTSLDRLSSMNSVFLVDEPVAKAKTLNESPNNKTTAELEKEDESVTLANKTKLADSFPSRNNSTIDVKNKSHIIFLNNSISQNEENSDQTESLVLKEENKIVLNNTIVKENRAPSISFRSRRLLSLDEDKEAFKTVDATYQEDDDESISTTIDDEEIESTDAAYHDKDQAILELTHRLMLNDLKPNKTEPFTTSKSSLIDSIEQRLTKRGKTNVEVAENSKTQTEKVILHVESDSTRFPLTKLSSFSLAESMPATQMPTLTTRRLRKIFKNNSIELLLDENEELNKEQTRIVHDFVDNSTMPSLIVQKSVNTKAKLPVRSALKKQVKFVKSLPKINFVQLEEHKEKRLDNLSKLLISANKRSKEEFSNEDGEELGDDSFDDEEKDNDILESDEVLRLNRSSTTPTKSIEYTNSSTTTAKIETTTINTTLPAKSFNKKSDEYKIVSSTGSFRLAPFTQFMSDASKYQSIASTAFVPSKHSSRPFMQTYRINQTKKLPNQFASLRLNYEQNPVTKIDEVERGGKFQRLRVVPADTLIECKENDFGLECSCSITLSPPKCKQLINSFLSSCRILGCKNNGRCINMAYKYPSNFVFFLFFINIYCFGSSFIRKMVE